MGGARAWAADGPCWLWPRPLPCLRGLKVSTHAPGLMLALKSAVDKLLTGV